MRSKKSKSELAKLVDLGKKVSVGAATSAGPIGRPRSKHPRTSSHIPLRPDERAKLGKAAEALGLPYATWARMTLLIVADWPVDRQPIRGFGPAMSIFATRMGEKGKERSYDGGKSWCLESGIALDFGQEKG